MSGAVGDDNACVMDGAADIDKVEYQLKLTDTTFTWIRSVELPGKTCQTSVPVREVVSVQPYTGKRSPTDAVDGFTLCYVEHKKKFILKRVRRHFATDSVTAGAWIQKIQGLLDTLMQRPRKCLVIVNPVSGKKKGCQACRDVVEPIFTDANIQTDIVVTERAHHTEEVLAKYDLSSIDSLVLVGGDGLYHEAVNGLQTRLMSEAGLDPDNPESEIQSIMLPIGLIPCGSGNGLATGSYGCRDVETAALAIMTGNKMDNNIFCVFACNKLICYSICVIGYVLLADIIYVAERRRYLGVLRYAVTMAEYTLIRFGRCVNMTMDYLTSQETSQEKTDRPSLENTQETSPDNVLETSQEKIDGQGLENTQETNPDIIQETTSSHTESGPQAACSQSTADRPSDKRVTTWKSVTGPAMCLMVFHSDFFQVFNSGQVNGEEVPAVEIDDDYTRFALIKPCSRGFIMKFFFHIIQGNASVLHSDKVVHDLVKEFKVRVDDPSDPESDSGTKNHHLNIDGELFRIPEPAFHVKLHTKKIRMFSSLHDT